MSSAGSAPAAWASAAVGARPAAPSAAPIPYAALTTSRRDKVRSIDDASSLVLGIEPFPQQPRCRCANLSKRNAPVRWSAGWGEAGSTRTTVWAAAVAACAAASVAVAQAPESPGDWPMYSRDHAGTRFSPLEADRRDQRRKAFAEHGPSRSRAAPTTKLRAGPAGNPQATPIVVDGVPVSAGARQRGARPRRSPRATSFGATPCRLLSPPPRAVSPTGRAKTRSGLAFCLSAGPTLVALDARTRRAPRSVSVRNGVVQIGVPGTVCRLVYGNLAMLGATTEEVALGPAGRHTRVRRPHRSARLDVSHGAAARRSGSRRLARSKVGATARASTCGRGT